jgi:hypothetical protein
MTRNKKRTIAAVGVIAALAAGGAAFTNSLDISAQNYNAGFNSVTVQGGENVSSVVYGFNPDGSQITSVKLTFNGDLSSQYVAVSFNGTSGNLTQLKDSKCVLDGTSNAQITGTKPVVDCAIDTGTGGAPTHDATNLNVLVTDNSSY